jgi:hypothetical protein
MARSPALVALEDLLVIAAYMIVGTLGFLSFVLLVALSAVFLALHL